MFVFISQSIPYFLSVIFFSQCACRTYIDTLTAQCAVDFIQCMTKCRTYDTVKATANAAQDINTLYIFTYSFTTTAIYAFVRIAHNSYAAIVHWECALFPSKTNFTDTHLMSQLLQFTVTTAHTVQTVGWMVG